MAVAKKLTQQNTDKKLKKTNKFTHVKNDASCKTACKTGQSTIFANIRNNCALPLLYAIYFIS